MIETKLDYRFKDPKLLERAFIHSSYVNEHPEEQSNERLEFLGDAILQLVISEELFKKFPAMSEGEMSRLRAQLVDARACASYVEKLGVTEHLKMGRGEQSSQRGRLSIHADLFEAIVGALYLDGGVEEVREFILKHCAIEEAAKAPQRNYKAELQDFAQRGFGEAPHYRVTGESGPDHDKHFDVEVLVGGDVIGWGSGPSKKEAQQAAAEDAVRRNED